MSSRLLRVPWIVITHPAVDEWLATIDKDTLEQIAAGVRELQDKAPRWAGRSPTRSRGRGTRT